jgi:hypothetical protein
LLNMPFILFVPPSIQGAMELVIFSKKKADTDSLKSPYSYNLASKRR